jgi:hypothetical protein
VPPQAEEGLLANFGELLKSGMGVSPVTGFNRKDGRDARATLSVKLGSYPSERGKAGRFVYCGKYC